MTTYDADWLPVGRTVDAQETIAVRCTSCGGEVSCSPSKSTYGRWYGVGACGERVLVTGRPRSGRQPTDGLARHSEGGCREVTD